jgi:hypothetical protein
MRRTALRLWVWWATAWHERRDERGGVTDETAMMGVLLVVAVTVGGIVYGIITGWASDLNLELPGSGD